MEIKKDDYPGTSSGKLRHVRRMFPASLRSVIMLILQVSLIAAVIKISIPPVREGFGEVIISILAYRANEAVESGDFELAGTQLRGAIAIGSERLSVNRKLMETSRHCDRDVWTTATAIVFFHRDSSNADRREILMWSLLHGELAYFDKLVSCLPHEWITQDRVLSHLVELRAEMFEPLSRNETARK